MSVSDYYVWVKSPLEELGHAVQSNGPHSASSVRRRLATRLRLGFLMLWMLWMWLLPSCCHCFHCLSLSRFHTIVNLDGCWWFVSWSDSIVSSHQSRGLSFGSRPENIEARAVGRWSLTWRPVKAWATLGSTWLGSRARARALTSLQQTRHRTTA